MILLDTTVLLYAVGSEHSLREPCRDLVAAIGEGMLRATATVEVLQEFAHVRARRRGRDDTAALTAQFATLLAPLLSPDADDLADGLRIFRDGDRIGAFDAVLAAVALRREHLVGLASADRAFSGIPGLRHVDPGSDGFLAELGLAATR